MKTQKINIHGRINYRANCVNKQKAYGLRNSLTLMEQSITFADARILFSELTAYQSRKDRPIYYN